MNTLTFLKNLKGKHYFVGLRDDLEMFLSCFSKEMFDLNYLSIYPNGSQDFLKQIATDILDCTPKEFFEFYEYIRPYIHLSTPPVQQFCLAGKNYLLKHYKDLDIPKYKDLLFKGIVLDFQTDLQYGVSVEFQKKQNSATAAAGSFIVDTKAFSNHTIYYNTNDKLPRFHKEKQLFYVIYCAFHEEYHCLVSELIHNPTCFKEEIFDFAMTRFYINELDVTNTYYRMNYDINKEEASADLYAISKAITYLDQHILNFPFWKIDSEIQFLTKSSHENQMVHKRFSKKFMEQAWIEEEVTKGMQKYPFLLDGILTRAFQKDGTRKDFIALLDDKVQMESQYPLLIQDIKEFYSVLQYRALARLNDDERILLFENDFYQKDISDMIVTYTQYLKKKIKQTLSKNIPIYTIPHKLQTLALYHQELKRLNSWHDLLEQRKGEDKSYGL